MTQIDEILAEAAARASHAAAPGVDARPRRRLAVLTCMDARIDAHRLLGLELGDAHVIRNAGGIVTDDAIRSLAVSQRMLGTEEVLVVMHEGCGLLGASDDDFDAALRADGVSPGFSLGAFDDLDAAVRAGVERLRSSPELPVRDRIHGAVLDPGSGALRQIG
jgi:carbonic anhydrase